MKRVRRLFGKGQAGADEAQGEGEIVATGDVAHRSEGEAVPAEFARPRSRADIMQDVAAAGFMREDFDAIGHLLSRLPDTDNAAELATWLAMQCGVIDEEVDVVGAQLTRKVLENYNAFISGMRGIQDLDLDLTRAGIHVSNGRRVIRNAQERLVAASLHVVQMRRRRDREVQALRVANKLKSLAEVEQRVEHTLGRGQLQDAASAAAEAGDVCEEDIFSQLSAVSGLRERVRHMLPRVQEGCTARAAVMCAARFDGAVYTEIQRALAVVHDATESGDGAGEEEEGGGEGDRARARARAPSAAWAGDASTLGGFADHLKTLLECVAQRVVCTAVADTLHALDVPAPGAPAFEGGTTCAWARAGATRPPNDTASAPSADAEPLPTSPPDVMGAWGVADADARRLFRAVPVDAFVPVLGRVVLRVESFLAAVHGLLQWHRHPFHPEAGSAAFLGKQPMNAPWPDSVSPEEVEAAVGSEGEGDDEDDDYRAALKLSHQAARRRERARHAALQWLGRQLMEGRDDIWLGVQKRIALLLQCLPCAKPRETRVAQWAAALSILDRVLALGTEFCATMEQEGDSAAQDGARPRARSRAASANLGPRRSHTLLSTARDRCRAYLQTFHQATAGRLRTSLGAEAWVRLPLEPVLGGASLESLIERAARPYARRRPAGRALLRQASTDSVSRPTVEALGAAGVLAPTGGGGVAAGDGHAATYRAWEVGERLPQRLVQDAKRGPQEQWEEVQALEALAARRMRGEPADGATVAEGRKATVEDSDEGGEGEDDAQEGGVASAPQGGDPGVATPAAVNGVLRRCGKYMRIAANMPQVSGDAGRALLSLYEDYLLFVTCNFCPREAAAVLVSTIDSGLASRLRSTLPAKAGGAFFATTGSEDAPPPPAGSAHSASATAAHVARTTARRARLRAQQMPELATVVVRALNRTVAAADGAASRREGGGANHADPNAHSGAGAADGGASDEDAPTPLAGSEDAASASGSRRLSRLMPRSRRMSTNALDDVIRAARVSSPGEAGGSARNIRRSSVSAGVGNDARDSVLRVPTLASVVDISSSDSFFGLQHRVVACESAAFVLRIVTAALKAVWPRIPSTDADALESALAGAEQACTQLGDFVLSTLAPMLLRMDTPVSTLVADECWDQKSLAEKPHEWVSKVVAIVREMDQRVAAVVSGHDLPSSVSSRLFRHATMFLMEELVDGISRVKKCSVYGRSLMAMDLQTLVDGLSRIRNELDTRARMHVEAYIKAYYFEEEEDLVAWIRENKDSYERAHLQALVTNMFVPKKKLKKKKAQTLVERVDTLLVE